MNELDLSPVLIPAPKNPVQLRRVLSHSDSSFCCFLISSCFCFSIIAVIFSYLLGHILSYANHPNVQPATGRLLLRLQTTGLSVLFLCIGAFCLLHSLLRCEIHIVLVAQGIQPVSCDVEELKAFLKHGLLCCPIHPDYLSLRFAYTTVHNYFLYFLFLVYYSVCMPRKSTQINKDLHDKLKDEKHPDPKSAIELRVRTEPNAGKSWGTVKYADAFMSFVFEGKSYREVSKAHGIPEATLKQWGKRDKWLDQRRETEQEIMESLRLEALKIYKDNRSALMLKHLAIGDNLDRSINAALVDNMRVVGDKTITDLQPSDIRELAVALKNSADVTHRIVKITDKSEEGVGNTIFNGPVQVNVRPATKLGKVIDL